MPLPDNALAWNVILDPLGVATGRTQLDISNPLSGIQIGGTSSGQGIDWGQATVTELLAQEGQYGSTLADYLYPNRTITIPLGLGMGGPGTPDANSALSTLAQKVGLLQREGGWLLRQREGGEPMYADIVDAQLTVPDTWGETGGIEPGVTLTLIAIPDWYGNEIALDSIPCTGYCDAVLTSSGAQAVIEGDYKTRCRLVVEDTSGNQQGSVIWGTRSRYYDSQGDASLAYQATGLERAGGSSSVTLAGSYSPTVVQSETLPTGAYTYFAGLYDQAQTGTYAVWVRAYPSATSMRLQLQWYHGSRLVAPTPTVNTAVELSTTLSGYQLANLGTVTLLTSPVGQNAWSALLYAMPSGTGQTMSVDMIWLQPLAENAGMVPPPPGANGAVLGNSPLEVRSDGLWRGYHNVYSTLFGYGDLPRLPPSGTEGRAVELFVKPSRFVTNDPVTPTYTPDGGIDTFTVTPYYRPSYMFRP